MKIRFIYILFFLAARTVSAQLTIELTTPSSTPPNDSIFMQGGFNYWNLSDSAYRLTPIAPNHYSIRCIPPLGTLQYYFTSGALSTIEGSDSGTRMPLRTYNYDGTPDTLTLSVASWLDSSVAHTTTARVHLLSDSFYIPQLSTYRRIWIYLPAGYDTSTIAYPVFYLQDGQQLFDKYYNPLGEWRIDESMDSLAQIYNQDCIVVGIDNAGPQRDNEYLPYVSTKYNVGGNGDRYTDFLVHTLKPYVDTHYRTLSDRDHTGIGGTRLGGLIAIYTALKHNDIFSKVGMMTPSFYYTDSILPGLEYKYVDPTKFYFIIGSEENINIGLYIDRMVVRLRSLRVPEENIFYQTYFGYGKEPFRSKYYPEMYKWLFLDPTNKIISHKDTNDDLIVYPNPVTNEMHINFDVKNEELLLYDINMKLIQKIHIHGRDLYNINGLVPGIYFAKGQRKDNGNPIVIKFIKQ